LSDSKLPNLNTISNYVDKNAYVRVIILGINLNKLFLLTLVLVLTLGQSGCKKTAENSNEITFWHFQSEPKYKAALKKLIEKFETENNCKVKTVELSWGDGKTKIISAFNSRIAPDVLELGSDWVAQFSGGGVLADITNDVDLNQFIPASQAPCLWKNKVYTLPWYVDTRVIYVNKSLLKKYNAIDSIATWQDILKVSQIINGKDSYGFGVNGADPHRLYKKIMPLLWSNGADLFTNGKATLNSANAIEALKMYITLSKFGIVESQKNLDNLFLQGRIGLLFSGGWLLDKLKKSSNSFEFEIINVPNFNSNLGKSFTGGEYIGISASTKKKELSVKFLKYITSGAVTLEYCKNEIGTVLPADKDYFNHQYFQERPYMNYFIQQIANSKMTDVHKNWLDIEEILENAVEKALYGVKSPEAALKEANQELRKFEVKN